MKESSGSDDIDAICKAIDAKTVYESTHDDLHITVLENGRYRWFSSGQQTVHSVMSLNRSWRTVLPYADDLVSALSLQKKTEHILLLGLGGGDLVRYLAHTCPAATITALEKNDLVINIFQQFFNPEKVPVSLIHADICEWQPVMDVEQDIIFLDVYGDASLPACLYQEALYETVFQLLAEDGILAANFAVKDEQEAVNLLGVIQQVFEKRVLFLAIEGHKNLLVIAFKSTPDQGSVKRFLASANWISLLPVGG